jgi:hypothetical protein
LLYWRCQIAGPAGPVISRARASILRTVLTSVFPVTADVV